MKRILTLIISTVYSLMAVHAQTPSDTADQPTDSTASGKTRLLQQPGLSPAASKIFFSDKRWSISGFGEYNYVPLQQNVSTTLDDLELYYSGLYRQAVFFGYRLTDKLIWNSEFQVEFIHYKNQESRFEFAIEAFIDYLFKDYLKARVGFYPLTIGYVNNNDEPIMFYSVNRSEVERLIIPSTWIEFGAMLYGNISRNWSYALGFSQGLNSRNYMSSSWIRQGREIRVSLPKSLSVNPQINYHGIRNLTLSASGYYGQSGQGHMVDIHNRPTIVKGKINLTSAYARYDWNNFRFLALGTYGQLGDTEKIYEETKDEHGANGQVLGEKTYGYLFEAGCNILHYFRKNRQSISHKKTFLYNNHDIKLSLFVRYERLNTHQSIHQDLIQLPRTESNMNIFTLGINFNTKENIVFKSNYQYRNNKSEFDPSPVKHIIEAGVGFIF